MGLYVGGTAVTLLDINNTVPSNDIYYVGVNDHEIDLFLKGNMKFRMAWLIIPT